MEYHFKTIPHSEQNYPTVGNYYLKDGIQNFRVSDLGNDDYHFLVLIHEMIEQYLTMKRNISEESITAFDVKFEQERLNGEHSPDEEPGFAINCPYAKEHFFAETIERLLAHELNIQWDTYNKTVLEL